MPVSVLAGLVIGGLVYEEELTSWFTGEEIGVESQPSSMATPQPTSMAMSGAISQSSGGSHEGHGHRGDEISHYTCSMHTSVHEAGPGSCPICSMDLTPVTFEELESGVIVIDAGRRRTIGVRTETIRREALSMSIRAVGRVTYDESRIQDVTVRVDGWVERLRANVTGDAIERGDTLFTMYSPDLLATQQELLGLIQSNDRMSERLAELARTRLRLWGLSSRQIRRIEESGEARESISIRSPSDGFIIEKNVFTGGFVEAGERVYQIAALDRVWIEADVYESSLPHIAVGLPVTVTFPHTGYDPIRTEIAAIYPYLSSETRTGRIRLELDNPDLALLPEMYADVAIEVPLGDVLAVPVSAVIYTGPRRLVFVDLGGGRLQPREIEIGSRSGQFYVVLSGLSEGDIVVSSGNFLVAAESRIRSTADFWGATDETE